MPAPWWPVGLRDPELMLRWVPGAPLVAPAVPDVDVAALLRLAADEPDGSTTQATLLHLARSVQHSATSYAQQDVDILEGQAGVGRSLDRDAIALAAIPLPIARPADDEDEPAELVLRDGRAAQAPG